MKNNGKINKKRHLASVAIIFDTNKRVLLVRRNEPRATHAHNKWSFPGGGINFGEHPKVAVIREIKEEIGIDIKLLSNEPFIISHLFEPEQVHAILFGYPAMYVSGKLDTKNDRETGEASWFNLSEINYSACLPQVKKMVEIAQTYL